MIDLRQGDCLEVMKTIGGGTIDLVVIDPPYLIENTKAGGNSKLAKSIQVMNNEIKENNLTNGFDIKCLDELFRVMKKPNIYIWCNHKQIPMYLDYFVKEKDCSFDIIIWNKTNAMPLFNNKYLTDKEYCLYFRKGGYCNPNSYIDAKTVYYQPINIKDKRLYNHPTIKPLNIIETIIKNSSNENDTVLDCFMGSGTTGVACVNTNRNFIGIELDETYFNIAKERISSIRDEDI
jgi:DNA modification methylase